MPFAVPRAPRAVVIVSGLIAAVMLTGAACTALRVRSYAPSGVDLSVYRSYAWEQGDTLQVGDPRLDNNPFFQERIQNAVDRELAARGLELAPARSDLLVHYHASVTQDIDVQALDVRYGACEDCQPYVYDAGTLLVDLVDARTGRLVWRGWAEDSLDGIIDNQDLLEQRVDEAIARILAEAPLPRRR